MATLGHHGLAAWPVHRRSDKALENKAEVEPPNEKPMKNENFIHTDGMEEETLSNDENGELDRPRVIKDVSQQGFTISESLMVCGMQLGIDVDDVKLSQFNFRNLKNNADQGATRVTTKHSKVWTTSLLGKRGVTKIHESSFKVVR